MRKALKDECRRLVWHFLGYLYAVIIIMATIGNISALLSSVHLPEDALAALSFPSKSIILEEGEVADKLYYVRSGCLRLAFSNDGKDITFQFFFPGDIVASFDSLHNGAPSLFSLESLEPSELLAIDGKELKNIILANDVLRDEYEKLLADRFHAYQQLFLSRNRNTPRQRYEELLGQNPEIVSHIPQHYIASYLGITPVSLSRIRARL